MEGDQELYNELFQLNLDELDFLKEELKENNHYKEIPFSNLELNDKFTVIKNSQGE